MQIDLGNAMHGVRILCCTSSATAARRDSSEGVRRRQGLVIIGDGDVKWHEVFDVVESQGATDWYIVEQENYPYPPLESAERSLKALKAMGK